MKIGILIFAIGTAVPISSAMSQNMLSPNENTDSKVVGSNPIPVWNQANSNCTSPVSDVIRVHIRANLLTSLSTGIICRSDCLFEGKQAPMTGVMTFPPDDDDGKPETPLAVFPPPAQLPPQDPVNWNTPIDIDLNGHWDASKHPILIKLILDDNSLHFFQSVQPSGSDVSQYAVRAGDASPAMFVCREPSISPDTVNAGASTLRVRVVYWNTLKVKAPADGGLNIGILVPLNNSQPPGYIPITIDPKVHNDG